QRLVASVTRFLDPDAALSATADGLVFVESRPLGGTWVLDGLWQQLEIGKARTGSTSWTSATPRTTRTSRTAC
ncbi:hypothetical protein, partial [Streptomyces sp. NPDC052107]|uniref:hypothetical protein n=1 Tax=Streptomyces sp. NPDC052107 TaxID=3155632 RepID=UPI003417C01D